jgi:hypothetical protein
MFSNITDLSYCVRDVCTPGSHTDEDCVRSPVPSVGLVAARRERQKKSRNSGAEPQNLRSKVNQQSQGVLPIVPL